MSVVVSRNNSLELLRFGAALSVLYGHLVWSATYATDISDFVGSVKLPLIPEDTHSLWQFQSSYGAITHGGNITAVGIAIFFLITGWLTPDLMERYQRKAYLINRFFRIMPLLVFATLLSAAIIRAIGGTMPVTAEQQDPTPRQRARGGGRKPRLAGIDHQLFFVLFYFKCYPTFDLAGFCLTSTALKRTAGCIAYNRF